MNDAKLLEQFVQNQSEAAFAELVKRHVSLVYSVAFRKTGNPQQAEDITQAVFIILARKAASLRAKTVLPGWLYHTARLTAANAHRADMRRLRHEQEAFMQSMENESAPDAVWRELSPLLEDAMAGMGASDRDALVLRYFKNLSLADVGVTLGLTESAAQRRVGRALEKLRRFFARRGVESTTAVIAGAISSNSLLVVPPAFAKSVTSIAVAKGAAASTSTLTLVKGALKIMAWTKTKTAIATAAGILLVAGTMTITVKEVRNYRTHAAKKKPTQIAMAEMNDAKNLAFCCILYAEHNGRQFPANFNQITVYTNRYPVGAVADFQIVYQGSIKKIVKPAETIVIQGTQSWQMGGKWAKVYAFADGHAEVQARANGDFHSFEERHTFHSR